MLRNVVDDANLVFVDRLPRCLSSLSRISSDEQGQRPISIKTEDADLPLSRMASCVNAVAEGLNQTSLRSSPPSHNGSPFSTAFEQDYGAVYTYDGEGAPLVPLEERFPFLKDDQKRTRKLLTAEQTRVLEAVLERTIYPSTPLREAIARQLSIPARKVQIWFQNKRQGRRRFSVSDEMVEVAPTIIRHSIGETTVQNVGLHGYRDMPERDAAMRRLADDMCLAELRDEFGRQFAELRLNPACRDQRELHPVPGIIHDADVEMSLAESKRVEMKQCFHVENAVGLHCAPHPGERARTTAMASLPLQSITMQRSNNISAAGKGDGGHAHTIHAAHTNARPRAYQFLQRKPVVSYPSLLRSTSASEVQVVPIAAPRPASGVRRTTSTADLAYRSSVDGLPVNGRVVHRQMYVLPDVAFDRIGSRSYSSGEQSVAHVPRSAIARRSTVVGVVSRAMPYQRPPHSVPSNATTAQRLEVRIHDANQKDRWTTEPRADCELKRPVPPRLPAISRGTGRLDVGRAAMLTVPPRCDHQLACRLRHVASSSSMVLSRRLAEVAKDVPVRSRLRSHSDVVHASSRSVRGQYQRQPDHLPVILPSPVNALPPLSHLPTSMSTGRSSSNPSPPPTQCRETLPSIAELIS